MKAAHQDKIPKKYRVVVSCSRIDFQFNLIPEELNVSWVRGSKYRQPVELKQDLHFKKTILSKQSGTDEQSLESPLPSEEEKSYSTLELIDDSLTYNFEGTFFFDLKKNTFLKKNLFLTFDDLDASVEINLGKFLKQENETSVEQQCNFEIKKISTETPEMANLKESSIVSPHSKVSIMMGTVQATIFLQQSELETDDDETQSETSEMSDSILTLTVPANSRMITHRHSVNMDYGASKRFQTNAYRENQSESSFVFPPQSQEFSRLLPLAEELTQVRSENSELKAKNHELLVGLIVSQRKTLELETRSMKLNLDLTEKISRISELEKDIHELNEDFDLQYEKIAEDFEEERQNMQEMIDNLESQKKELMAPLFQAKAEESQEAIKRLQEIIKENQKRFERDLNERETQIMELETENESQTNELRLFVKNLIIKEKRNIEYKKKFEYFLQKIMSISNILAEIIAYVDNTNEKLIVNEKSKIMLDEFNSLEEEVKAFLDNNGLFKGGEQKTGEMRKLRKRMSSLRDFNILPPKSPIYSEKTENSAIQNDFELPNPPPLLLTALSRRSVKNLLKTQSSFRRNAPELEPGNSAEQNPKTFEKPIEQFSDPNQSENENILINKKENVFLETPLPEINCNTMNSQGFDIKIGISLPTPRNSSEETQIQSSQSKDEESATSERKESYKNRKTRGSLFSLWNKNPENSTLESEKESADDSEDDEITINEATEKKLEIILSTDHVGSLPEPFFAHERSNSVDIKQPENNTSKSNISRFGRINTAKHFFSKRSNSHANFSKDNQIVFDFNNKLIVIKKKPDSFVSETEFVEFLKNISHVTGFRISGKNYDSFSSPKNSPISPCKHRNSSLDSPSQKKKTDSPKKSTTLDSPSQKSKSDSPKQDSSKIMPLESKEKEIDSSAEKEIAPQQIDVGEPMCETPKKEKIETPKIDEEPIAEENVEIPQLSIEVIPEQSINVVSPKVAEIQEEVPAHIEEEEYDENKVLLSLEGENKESQQNESIIGNIRLDSESNLLSSPNSNGKPSFYTPIDEIEEKVLRIKKSFFIQKPTTRSYAWRLDQLKKMKKMMVDKKKYWYKAMKLDLKQTDFLCLLEVQAIISELDDAIDNLKDWMNPVDKKVTSLMAMGAECQVFKEPYGTALIIAPWNYPIQLALKPLIRAIAAGNCAAINPSVLSEACSQLIAKLIPEYLDPDCFCVIQGGIEETKKLLECKFDYIFTGNPQVTDVVMGKSSKCPPLSIELRGKSPVYVHHDASVRETAKRIMLAKTMHCGQTCVSPNYVLVHKKIFPKLKIEFLKVLKSFFGDKWEQKNPGNNNKINLQVNNSYSRIISKKNTKRLKEVLVDLESYEKNLELCGGSELVDEEDCFVPPTLIAYDQPKTLNSEFFKRRVMQEEIFGPILPIISVEDEFEALNFICGREKPLASYVFTKSKEIQQLFILNSSSGGIGINECVMHLASAEAPFEAQNTFSHEKTIMIKKFGMEPSQRFPPYTKKKIVFLESIMNRKGGDMSSWFKTIGSTINYFLSNGK